MSNLIVIHSTIYLCFLGLNVMGIVFNLVKNYEEQGILWLDRDCCTPQKAMWGAHVGSSNNSSVRGISQLGRLTTYSWKAIDNYFIVFPFFLYPHYKSPYCLQNWKKSFREKTL